MEPEAAAGGLDLAGLLEVGGVTPEKIVSAIGVVLASVIAARVVYWLLERWVSRITSRTGTDLDDRLLALAKKPIYYTIILAGFYAAFTMVLVTAVSGVIGKFVAILVILIATWFAGRMLDALIVEFGGKLTSMTNSTADDEALPFLSKVARITLYIIAFSIILDKLGYSITPIITSLGLLGFAAGFAAKDTLSNILAGFFILADRPFKLGDRIQLGDTLGEVIDIGLRTTKVKTLDHNVVIIPNNKMVTDNVTNYQMPDIKIKLIMPFSVAYGSDVAKAKQIIVDVAAGAEMVLDDPAPKAFFTEFGDSSLNIKAIVWIGDLRKKWTVKDAINSAVNQKFAEEGIEIPFPHRTVYMKKEE